MIYFSLFLGVVLAAFLVIPGKKNSEKWKYRNIHNFLKWMKRKGWNIPKWINEKFIFQSWMIKV